MDFRRPLTEEKYVKNLEKIIVRDYFPELPKLKAQSEYIEALSKNDHAKIRELQIRYSTRRLTDRRTSPSARPSSPSVFDSTTPSSSNINETPYANKDGDNELYLKKKKSEDILNNISLQSYLDKFTSEDNASFKELVQLHNKRERIKNAWMYEAEEIHNKSLIYRGPNYINAADEQLMAIKDNNIEKPPSLDNWSYKARNAVLFDLDEAPLTLEEYSERANRNKKIINKKATRFNKDFSQKTEQVFIFY